ncbi:hypothetical protein Q1695_007781 [Nippostrongylus brasiliensis]|nr:hypothetical protein Q1695_007781 [Nippostrongylus brasiliensis]
MSRCGLDPSVARDTTMERKNLPRQESPEIVEEPAEEVDCTESMPEMVESVIAEKSSDPVKEVVDELVGKASFWGDPSAFEVELYSLDYRKAPSIASASSDAGSEFGDLSDTELPPFESDEDSDREFERLQHYTCEMRNRTFKQEHPDGLTQKKRLRTDKVNTKDLEHEYDTLPPLENLTIHCEESISLEVVGRVVSIVDCLVVVQSDVAVALDFDSVLFDKDRNSIGVVFDLFGPVKSPLYSIRFNSKEEAAKMTVGMKVYYAPTAEAYTKKVIEENIKEREVPSGGELSEDEPLFSDDEKEKEYRQRKYRAKANRPEASERRGQKRRVQFSDSTPQRGRGGGDRGGYRGRGAGRGGSWDWHNTRDGSNRFGQGRGTFPRRGRGRSIDAEPGAPSSTFSGNPYAEYRCYGSVPFSDSRSH